MRNVLITSIVIGLFLSVISFLPSKTVITGKVRPPDAAEQVWLLSEKDSLKTGLSDGQFSFDVKPGAYKLVVAAVPPYKDVLLDNLVVKMDETLDLGEITLKQ